MSATNGSIYEQSRAYHRLDNEKSDKNEYSEKCSIAINLILMNLESDPRTQLYNLLFHPLLMVLCFSRIEGDRGARNRRTRINLPPPKILYSVKRVI